MFYRLKKYKKLNAEQDAQLKSLFGELNDENKAKVVKQAKKIITAALISAIIIAVMFATMGVLAIFMLGWLWTGVMFAFAGWFGYYCYTAISWKKVEDYELCRVTGINWVQSLLSKQMVQEEKNNIEEENRLKD